MTGTATVVGWTGRGRVQDLRKSAAGSLVAAGLRVRVLPMGRHLVVYGVDPTEVVGILRELPGVSWVGAGLTVGSLAELGKGASRLAKKYIRKGEKFRVLAEGSKGIAAGDLAAVVASAVLESVKGSRTSEELGKVTFRVVSGPDGLAFGVELARGPGGIPMNGRRLTCLVSGGMHSSVVAWMALLAGFRVDLVHAEVDGESTRVVAGLYAELSQRVDPAGLTLQVMRGGDPAKMIRWRVRNPRSDCVDGSGFSRRGTMGPLAARSISPLALLPEEEFAGVVRGLRVRKHERLIGWTPGAEAPGEILTFAHERADVSGVLDGLRVRQTRRP